ncbi:MAG: RIFT barrel domain-containing protein, partial [Paraglaciecola chathamensis]
MMTYANSADRIPINLTNTPLDGMVKTSVPLAKGLLYDIHQSQLMANGQVIDCGAKVLATWQDKSVKWLHLS